MLSKLILGAALVLTLGLSGGVWAFANKKAESCCHPGADCCYPGSPCCYPGSPCCDAPTATPSDAGAKKADCCPGAACCDGGKCCAGK